jgi:hypothetical protein
MDFHMVELNNTSIEIWEDFYVFMEFLESK